MVNPDDYTQIKPVGELVVGVCAFPDCDKPETKPAPSEKDARNRVAQHILKWHT